jgi:hypothetical protein
MAKSASVSSTKTFVAWQALTKRIFDDYRPELHYMRGKGAQMARKAPLGRDWRPVSGCDESLNGGSSAVSDGKL